MIVDTKTGEVINPCRLRSNNTYKGYYWVNHKHTHFYKPSGFTVATRVFGIARNVGGRVRRNSFSIFAIFAVLLFYVALVSKITGAGNLLTFSGLLNYFSNVGSTVESWGLVTYFRGFQQGGANWIRISNFRFDGLLDVLNPLLSVFSPLIRLLGYLASLFGFIGECFALLFSFLISIVTFLFGGLFM